jgi:hypothetical protein
MSWKQAVAILCGAKYQAFLSWFGRNRLLRNRHTRATGFARSGVYCMDTNVD